MQNLLAVGKLYGFSKDEILNDYYLDEFLTVLDEMADIKNPDGNKNKNVVGSSMGFDYVLTENVNDLFK